MLGRIHLLHWIRTLSGIALDRAVRRIEQSVSPFLSVRRDVGSHPHSGDGLWSNHRATSRATNGRWLSRLCNGPRGLAAVRDKRLHESVATLRCKCNVMTGGALDETQALHMTPERRAMHAQMSCGMPYMPSICVEQALEGRPIQPGAAHRGNQISLGILRYPASAIAAPALGKTPSRPTTVR